MSRPFTLIAYNDCGCMSVAIHTEHAKPKDIGKFYADAYQRGCVIKEYTKEDDLPPWECEKHRAERLAKLKPQPSLFAEGGAS